jgi:hypothetical protein
MQKVEKGSNMVFIQDIVRGTSSAASATGVVEFDGGVSGVVLEGGRARRWGGPLGCLQEGLLMLHETMGLPWWATLTAATLGCVYAVVSYTE